MKAVRKTAFFPFRFQLKKNVGEAKEKICSVLDENAVSYSICKKY